MCTSLYCIHNFFQNCAIHCYKLLGLAFFQVIWNHFKIIYMYLLRLSFLLFYDTRITFMINTFTGNSWNVLVLCLQLSFDSSVMYMYYIHFILYLVMLMVGLFCFFYLFLLNTYTFTYMKAFVIITYLFINWSQHPDVKEFYKYQVIWYMYSLTSVSGTTISWIPWICWSDLKSKTDYRYS